APALVRTRLGRPRRARDDVTSTPIPPEVWSRISHSRTEVDHNSPIGPSRLRSLFAPCLSLVADDPATLPGNGDARIFFPDIKYGRLLSANPDGSDLKVLVEDLNQAPDGVAIDIQHGFAYWTNMGKPSVNDGSVQRANLDGSNVATIVPQGGAF